MHPTHVQIKETAQTTSFHTLVNVDMVTKETTVRHTYVQKLTHARMVGPVMMGSIPSRVNVWLAMREVHVKTVS